MNATIRNAIVAETYLTNFINPSQLASMRGDCRGEEGQFFTDKLVEMADLIKNMPKTYEQDGKGDDAIVTLHYFSVGSDWHWFIIEKDMGDGQHQAFGLGNHNGAGQFAFSDWDYGYISIVELLENDVVLDMYFTPCTLREIKEKVRKVEKEAA